MSYGEYLNNFADDRIEQFKESVLNSKDFTEAFLDATSHLSEEEQSSKFNSLIESMVSIIK